MEGYWLINKTALIDLMRIAYDGSKWTDVDTVIALVEEYLNLKGAHYDN